MRNIFLSLILATITLPLQSCSDDSMIMPENPEKPIVVRPANKLVIYEANPRFFDRTDCLKAIDNRLPEIKNMGANVVWLMPIYEPGKVKSVNSPYCIKDYQKVNPQYGTMTDLKTLVKHAHSLGLKVMLDWVANHTSWDHPWISSHKDWYMQDDEGNVISPKEQNWNDVADLNYESDELRTAMIDAMLYWVNEAYIDGFRCDYTDGVPHDFWTEAIARLRSVRPDLLMLSESENDAYFADGFDMIYGWKYASRLSRLFLGKLTVAKFLQESSEEYASVPTDKTVMRYIFNHDVADQNSATQLYGSADALPAAYTLSAMLEGVPLIYSSMESRLKNTPLSFFQYTPLNWDATMEQTYATINSAYAATTNVRSGELRTYENEKTIVFTHNTPQHTLLVLVNITNQPQTVKVPIACTGTSMQDMLQNQPMTMPAELELAAYGYAIYYQ